MSMKQQIKSDMKNPWLQGIVGAVAVTVGVNIVFITYAFISPPNLVVKDYYERGKSYFHEENLREQAAAEAWRLQLLPPQKPVVNEAQVYHLYVMDHQGRPVKNGTATLFAYRPSDAANDFKHSMSYSDVGTFSQRLVFPLPGHWDLIAQVRSGDQKYDIAKRIFVEK